MDFENLDEAKAVKLVEPFSMEDVKGDGWDCDSSTSDGPDWVNFGFLKEFWEDIKDIF